MVAQDAVLDDHMVVGLKEPGPPVVFEDDRLTVIR